MTLHVRRYRPEDEDALFAFRETIFPKGHKSLDRPHFRWKFVNHPYAEEVPFFIMEHKDRVVGTQGYWPFHLQIGNRRMTCSHLVDFNVEEAYRGLPTLRLFKAVSSCSQLNFGAYLSQDARRFFAAANWVDMSGELKNYYFPLQAPQKAGLSGKAKFFCRYLLHSINQRNRSNQARNHELKVELCLPDGIEDLISPHDVEHRPAFVKQRRFLVWRYEESEINNYRFASLYAGGNLKCCLVFNVSRDSGVTRCFIMDVFHLPHDLESIEILLIKLVDYLRQYRQITTIQSSALPELGEVFKTVGFGSYKSQMGFMCSRDCADILESYSPWKFTFNLGDTDFL